MKNTQKIIFITLSLVFFISSAFANLDIEKAEEFLGYVKSVTQKSTMASEVAKLNLQLGGWKAPAHNIGDLIGALQELRKAEIFYENAEKAAETVRYTAPTPQMIEEATQAVKDSFKKIVEAKTVLKEANIIKSSSKENLDYVKENYPSLWNSYCIEK